jgi:hypothetical protein
MSFYLMLQAAGQAASPEARTAYAEWLPLAAALIGACAALLVGLASPRLNRRAAKKGPKTEMRARAYGDFVVYQMQRPPSAEAAGAPTPELNEILGRLLVFGESRVLSAVASFIKNPEQCDLADVIVKMRVSVQTGAAEESIINILKERAPRLLRERASSG